MSRNCVCQRRTVYTHTHKLESKQTVIFEKHMDRVFHSHKYLEQCQVASVTEIERKQYSLFIYSALLSCAYTYMIAIGWLFSSFFLVQIGGISNILMLQNYN